MSDPALHAAAYPLPLFCYLCGFCHQDDQPRWPVPSSGCVAHEMLLSGSITVNGQTFASVMTVELTAGADPYFSNINPSEGNVWYLSQDLRVFTATPGINNAPIPGGPSLTLASNTFQDTNAGYGYIQSLLKYLTANYGNPTGVDPFTLFPDQSNSETADSSVTPSQFNPANPLGPRLTNYNFAVARVRLTGTPQTMSNPVKVFFRLWITSSCDTDYDPTGSYKSMLDAAGLTSSPQTGTTTIPFFATGNYVANTDYGINKDYTATSVNFYPITIGSSDSQWAYFGCFLHQRSVVSSFLIEVNSHLLYQSDGLANATATYHQSTVTSLSNVKEAVRAMVDEGARDDIPTGTTPCKRTFELIDHWQLTKRCESILKEKARTRVVNESNPMPNESQEPTIRPADIVEEPLVPDTDDDMLSASESFLLASLQSPESSSAETPRPAVLQPLAVLKKAARIGGPKKSALPTMGTLTDRPTNLVTSRRPRRAR
jgi:hypothetical protein